MSFQDFEIWTCNFNYLAFIFDMGPFGEQGTEEVHCDFTGVRKGIFYEDELKQDQSSQALRKLLFRTFNITDYLGDYEGRGLVGVLTVVLSLLLATDPQLRATFTANYRGRIPLITQSLIEIIGLGKSNQGFLVHQYDLENLDSLEIINALFLQASLLNPQYVKENFNNEKILLWFQLLQGNNGIRQSSYFPSVSFQPVSMAKSELSPLYDLWVENGQVWWRKGSSFENLSLLEKRFYLLLAIVLNLRFSWGNKFLSPRNYHYSESLVITTVWPSSQDLVQEFIELIFTNQKNYSLSKNSLKQENSIYSLSNSYSPKQVILQEEMKNTSLLLLEGQLIDLQDPFLTLVVKKELESLNDPDLFEKIFLTIVDQNFSKELNLKPNFMNCFNKHFRWVNSFAQ